MCFILIFIFPAFANAQADQKVKNDSTGYRNELSLVITDLIDGSYQCRYERKLKGHFSVGLGTAMKTKKGLVNISGIDKEKIQTSNITYSGFKLIPDVRYYLKKTQQYELDGFYFGAYSKYFHFGSDINGTYINNDSEEYKIDMNVNINILSMGFMVGYKLALNKRFTVDFLILGPGSSRQSYKIKNKVELPEEFYDDLNEALQNFSLYDFIGSDFRFHFQDAKTDFSTLSFRYGITVGYSF